MSHIDDWAKDKPKHIASIAQQLSFIITFGLLLIKSDRPELLKLFNAKTNINSDDWLEYYFKTKILIKTISAEFEKEGDFLASIGNYTKHLTELKKTLPIKTSYSVEELFFNNLPANSPEFKQITNQLYDISRTEIKNLNNIVFPDPLRHQRNIQFIPPEFVFALTVLLPSAIIYGEFPSKLYRKARLGDINALDMLLRIDKTIICDRIISKQIFRLSLKTNKSDLNRVATALKGKLTGKKSLQKAKFKIAGLISVLSERLGGRLSAPDIQSLFNAIAADSNNLEVIDTDLPDSPEAFKKAVARERPFWIAIFPVAV
jgi:hypothetical protein